MKRKNVVLALGCGLVLAGVAFNGYSYASYVEQFDTMTQSITAAPWKVDASVTYLSESVGGAVFEDFRPGHVKDNLITLSNANEYKTKFYLDIVAQGVSEDVNLFENPAIKMNFTPIGEKAIASEFECVVDDVTRVYSCVVEALPNEELWFNFNVMWDKQDKASEAYEGFSGTLTYTVRVEQVVEGTND